MVSYREKNITYSKIAQRFLWHNIAVNINEYVKHCEQCQKQGDLKSPKSPRVEVDTSTIKCDEIGWNGHLQPFRSQWVSSCYCLD